LEFVNIFNNGIVNRPAGTAAINKTPNNLFGHVRNSWLGRNTIQEILVELQMGLELQEQLGLKLLNHYTCERSKKL
jgi:hypothetical protein